MVQGTYLLALRIACFGGIHGTGLGRISTLSKGRGESPLIAAYKKYFTYLGGIQMSSQEIIQIIHLTLIFIGLSFGFYQWIFSNKFNRAKILKDLLDELRSGPLMEVYYEIEYSSNWYDASFHNSKEKERKFDKFFTLINYLCHLKNRKVITNNEYNIFKYEIDRICNNEGAKTYFWNLYHFSNEIGSKFPYNEILIYGKNNGFFKREFFSNNENYLNKYLNF